MTDRVKRPTHSKPPFVVYAGENARSPLVFSSPHSGRFYPPVMMEASRLSRQTIRRSEDAWVDHLIQPCSNLGIPIIIATYARAYVDLNRDPTELDERMFHDALPRDLATRSPRVVAGLGAVARVVADGEEIYRDKLPASDAISRIADVHSPFHAELTRILSATKAKFGHFILVDFHSMPSGAQARSREFDIVLGDRYGTSCSPLFLDILEAKFRSLGLTVARNQPFAGAYITEHYGDPLNGMHSVQVEVRRSLYMDEDTLDKTAKFDALVEKLCRVARGLVEMDWGPLRSSLGPRPEVRLAGE